MSFFSCPPLLIYVISRLVHQAWSCTHLFSWAILLKSIVCLHLQSSLYAQQFRESRSSIYQPFCGRTCLVCCLECGPYSIYIIFISEVKSGTEVPSSVLLYTFGILFWLYAASWWPCYISLQSYRSVVGGQSLSHFLSYKLNFGFS